ncbi:MAG: isoleucine--tRNA ligase [Bacteroidota bacterium]
MYRTLKQVNWPKIEEEVLSHWKADNTFQKSIDNRKDRPEFVFYEGPPSANGMPGIHHVMARAIKDIFCRYKTIQGFKVDRKGGWDTHGLPIELQVEKRLGITKEDIGKSISIEDYNAECRKDVMLFKDKWDELTERMGYWVDLDNPYITYETEYVETLWYLLKQLYNKGFLYKGYTIQPYSPAAGTGLSSHELNQPGTYKPVKDTTVVAQFKVSAHSRKTFKDLSESAGDLFFMAWTTTPWTLPSNTALAVGKNISYVAVQTYNQYTFQPIQVILAKNLMGKYFNEKATDIDLNDYKEGDKLIPFKVIAEYKGSDLAGMTYEQLLPFEANAKANIDGDAFKVIIGDFVTTEDGTGIVHIAPSFGADDFRVAKQNGIGALTLVDKQGKFIDGVGEFSHLYVKNYTDADEKDPAYRSTDVLISIKLKEENKAFKVEKYEHTYPHCWRTDKPILYYPLESWFIKTTAVKDRLVELNKTIQWKPQSTGEGRFGNWLENLVDWNLSRSRYWGTPLPIWRTEDGSEELCIGSIAELKTEMEKANAQGENNNLGINDLHRPYVDDIVLISGSGKKMYREKDLIDVWFDSGAMPYAQWGLNLSQTLSEGKGFNYETSKTGNYHLIKEYALKHRSNPTPAEAKLWEALKGDKLGGYHIRRQHIINDFIADFVCLKKGLVIEVDGLIHTLPDNIIADAERTKILNSEGFQVIRFTNDEILNNLDTVLASIKKALDSAKPRIASFPFGEGKEGAFPADFIAEGVDQTRGWFFTLHALSVMLFDSVAYKNVVANGLVLDKNGNKMSKRLGNAVDPFTTINTYGADITRWYMATNSDPWDNLKFDVEGLAETQRKFFGTLYNTYSFFAIYANIDNYNYDSSKQRDIALLSELDRWIISKLNTLKATVISNMDAYDPTPAARAIETFVCDDLSNWYIRLSRRRFWKGEMNSDKQSAYDTLFNCINEVAQLMSPFAPFFSEWLYQSLNKTTDSVHLTEIQAPHTAAIDKELETTMQLAQDLCSMVFGLRKKHNIKVRQPLHKIMVPVLNETFGKQLKHVEPLILSEVNVKEMEYLQADNSVLVKGIKPNFKALGPKIGAQMKELAAAIQQFTAADIATIESTGKIDLNLGARQFELILADVEITSQDIPGWLVSTNGNLTVALDITITDDLRQEGIAREFVNRLQNLRKDSGFEVTDRIKVWVKTDDLTMNALHTFKSYICTEILADAIESDENLSVGTEIEVEGATCLIKIEKNG